MCLEDTRAYLFGMASIRLVGSPAKFLVDAILGLASYGGPGKRDVVFRGKFEWEKSAKKCPWTRMVWTYPFDLGIVRPMVVSCLSEVEFILSGSSSTLRPSIDGESVRAATDFSSVDVSSTGGVTVRTMKDPLWLGWYRSEDIECVLWHGQRGVIEAVTGSCGCLFDRSLQMWLLPENTAAAFELHNRSLVTWAC